MKLPKLDCERTKMKIKSFLRENIGNKKAVIGLSGGVDSSVVLKLCEEAIGHENIIGVMLPSKYTKKSDLEDAIELAKKLRVEYHVEEIDDIVNKLIKRLELKGKISKGNVAPRVRMIILYSISNEHDGLVVGTTNKTEWLLGYFTKYGDGGVDLEPIIDLYKTHVKELAGYLGIPEKIISKPPSAGLWPGQTDEGELGIDYETLDKILYSLENKMSLHEFDDGKIERVKQMMRLTSHKRKFPPRGGVVYAKE